MKLNLLFGFFPFLCFVLFSCDSNIATGDNTNMDYINIWSMPQEKEITVSEGTITVVLIATGNYCNVYYDKNISLPSEKRLKQIVYNYDKGYEKVTSFLGLYEKGGGPGGNGGGDSDLRIQTYIYDLYPAGGRFSTYNGESVYIDIYNIDGSTFTHELCHLIYYGNYSASPENWYHEFLPITSDYVFHGTIPDWTIPNVELFKGWISGGGTDSWPYYNTYRKLAKYLVDKYGNTILYELYHQNAINKQALENVLATRSVTLSSVELDFQKWCNNYGR